MSVEVSGCPAPTAVGSARSRCVSGPRPADRRDSPRNPVQCDVLLLGRSDLTVLRCHVDDLSDGGLHATLPVGAGVAVGQRIEVRLPAGEAYGAAQSVLRRGTVVRIATDAGEVRNHVGFAVCFDPDGPGR